MKIYQTEHHKVGVELVPNPEMLTIHTDFDLHLLSGTLGKRGETLRDLLQDIDGLETDWSDKSSRGFYQLSLVVGKLFDRAEIGRKVAEKLLLAEAYDNDDPNPAITAVHDINVPFTIVGAFNNYSTYGPDRNGDGEIKVHIMCVLAPSPAKALEWGLAYLEKEGYRYDDGTDTSAHKLFDQIRVCEGNPFKYEELRLN